MAGELSNTEILALSVCSGACLNVLYLTWGEDGAPLFASLALSGLAYVFSYAIIRWTGDAFMRAGRKGRDMSKKVAIEMFVNLHIVRYKETDHYEAVPK